MDKNILNFLNLAKSTDEFRAHLTHAYASEKHIVTLDGHRMHYVDNAWNVRGFLSPGMEKDATFPPYERLIVDSNERVSLNQHAFTASNWKALLKELKTFDSVQFTVKNGFVAFNAFAGNQEYYWQKHVSPISKTLSVLIPLDEKLSDFQSPFFRASYIADALSPILHRKHNSSQMKLLLSFDEGHMLQIRCIVEGISYYAVLIPLAIKEPAQSKAA